MGGGFTYPILIHPILIYPTLVHPTLIHPTMVHPTLIHPILIHPTLSLNQDAQRMHPALALNSKPIGGFLLSLSLCVSLSSANKKIFVCFFVFVFVFVCVIVFGSDNKRCEGSTLPVTGCARTELEAYRRRRVRRLSKETLETRRRALTIQIFRRLSKETHKPNKQTNKTRPTKSTWNPPDQQ